MGTGFENGLEDSEKMDVAAGCAALGAEASAAGADLPRERRVAPARATSHLKSVGRMSLVREFVMKVTDSPRRKDLHHFMPSWA